MRRNLCAALFVITWWCSTSAFAQCEINGSVTDGSGQDYRITSDSGFALSDFSRRAPVRALGGKLAWVDVDKPAAIRRIGVLGNAEVYSVRHSPLAIVILTPLPDKSYCPIAILQDLPENFSVAIYTGEPSFFAWRGTPLMAFRVHYKGNANEQELWAFGFIDGRVVRLEERQWEMPWTGDPQWTAHHRGAGFCKDSLIFQVITGNDSQRHGTIRVHHRIDGRTMVRDRIERIPEEVVSHATLVQQCNAHYDDRPPQ
jgi:hypothetical protein